MQNKFIHKKVDPLNALTPNKILNSLWRVIKIFDQKNINRDGIIQKDKGRIKNPKKVLIQLKEKLKIEEEGSNTENKFIIILNGKY